MSSQRGARASLVRFVIGAMVLALPLVAQTPPAVVVQENFQSYARNVSPSGWIDSSVGQNRPEAKGLWKTDVDPTEGNKGTNIVYGTNQSSGRPEGNHPRIGSFSTLTTHEFDARGRFEFRGRLLRTDEATRIGVTFFSSYPERDAYYLLGLWTEPGSTDLTMQWFSFAGEAETPGGRPPRRRIHPAPRPEEAESSQGQSRIGSVGHLDTVFVPAPGAWARFLVQVDDTGDATHIRARFWPDGAPEPDAFQIEAIDSSDERLTRGRIGLWAAVRGGAYFDELFAKSPVDLTAPAVTFRESGAPLADGAKFNRSAVPEIVVTDDVDPSPSYSATLEGASYVSLTPVTTEGTHTISVEARDAAGNTSSARISLFIDRTAPVVVLSESGAAFPAGRIVNRDVLPVLAIEDISSTSIAATLDGAPYTFSRRASSNIFDGATIAAEGGHALAITVTDDLGWTASLGPVAFTIDKTPPVVNLRETDQPFSGGSFNRDLALFADVADETSVTLSMSLDDEPYTPGTAIAIEGPHAISATAIDAAGWTTTAGPVVFLIDKTKPEVTLLEGAEPFPAGFRFNRDVTPSVEVDDATPVTIAMTLDGAPYSAGTPITTDGPHEIAATVTDAVGWSVTIGPVTFLIDKTPPVVRVLEGGDPLADGALFDRDAVITIVVDDLTATTIEATLDGETWNEGSPVSDEREHMLTVAVTDAVGWSASAGPLAFVIDKTPPRIEVLEGAEPFPDGFFFNRDVTPAIRVDDLTATTITATLDGQPFILGSAISTEAFHTLAVTAVDALGHEAAAGPVRFTIDKTPPALSITSHADGQAVAAPSATIAGASDDAVTVTVAGREAIVDSAAKTFILPDITLLEGANTVTATGVDRAGNFGSATIRVTLDTRAPDLAVTSPANGSCLDAAEIVVTGVAKDAVGAGVRVEDRVASGAVTTVDAVVDSSSGVFGATIPAGGEGTHRLTIIATDAHGHAATASRDVTIDRTEPAIEITEAGAPFTASVLNRSVSLFIRATDADPGLAVVSTLDGQRYASGSSISAEGAHELVVTATDCAANASARTIAFTIDRGAPAIHEIVPADGSTVGAFPHAITGTTDDDVTLVEIVSSSLAPRSSTLANGAFTFTDVPLVEGLNRFTIRLVDRAGNASEIPYAVTVRTEAPVVEILESGSPIPDGALFNRAITPAFRVSDPGATVTATLDGSPFAAGAAISAEGAHTLVASAVDELGHSSSATVHFAIDRTPPAVVITSPAPGAIDADETVVAGTAGDSVSVHVNGIAATLVPGGGFTAIAPLDLGENAIVATGRDAAGNTGQARVDVTREDAGPAIIVTSPVDGTLTNRTTTAVSGRVLTPSAVDAVRIEGRGASGEIAGPFDLVPDAAGQFTLRALELFEGQNAITVTGVPAASKTARTTSPLAAASSVSVHINADMTAPSLTILADGAPLEEGARFATATTLAIETIDVPSSLAPPSSSLFIDGTRSTPSATVASDGGHSALAIATDAAGNQRRVERTFFIGETAPAPAACSITDLDPANGSVVNGASTRLAGRTTAPSVAINGETVTVADGSFCATVALPREGDNVVTLTCASTTGEPIGSPATITLKRVSGTPSITIDSPADGAVVVTELVTVRGTVSGDAVEVTVNGVSATLAPESSILAFTANPVRLSPGLNIIAVRAQNAGARSAIATRRIVFQKALPSIAITSPVGAPETGAASIDIRGMWANLDPGRIEGRGSGGEGLGAPSGARGSDTNGTFVIHDVPLQPGTNVITVAGSDSLGRETTAVATVTRTDGKPSIRIDDPLDNATLGASAVDDVTVTGTFVAAEGSTVQVNGVPATLADPRPSPLDPRPFSASVPLSTLAATPIVARVTEPGGASATDVIRVTKLASAPAVHETFPADGAIAVDPAALVLVSFTNPMDVETMGGAFSVVDDSGAAVSGTSLLDRDVLSFAPAPALRDGERYTIRVSTAATDQGGESFADEFTARFTVASTAPSTAPTIDPVTAECGAMFEVSGSAPAGARVRIDSGPLTLFTNANLSGVYRFTLLFTGRSGYQLMRVRVAGADGSLSPAAEQCVRFSCAGTRVVAARFDRAANALTIDFSDAIDASSISFGDAGTIRIQLQDGRTIGGAVTAASPSSIVITPGEDLAPASFDLTVTTGVRDASGNPLVAPYTQSFRAGGDEPAPGDGTGIVSGEVLSGSTGRPLPNVTIEVSEPVEAFSKPKEDPK